MDEVLLYAMAALVLSMLVGAVIGRGKQRTAAGAVWGLVLGPVGWLIVALGPDHLQLRAKRCPYCLGLLPVGQAQCAHCDRQVVWVRGEPRKRSGPATVISH